jgi:hypothetical protein
MPPFDDPTNDCPSIPSCRSVTRQGPKDWLVKCKGQSDNTLHKNASDAWVWTKGYNTATFATHKTPHAAISGMCPPFQDATEGCTQENNCDETKSVNLGNYGTNQTAIRCIGDSDFTNTLLGRPGRWVFYKGYNSATNGKYGTTEDAIRAYCNSTPRRGSYR